MIIYYGTITFVIFAGIYLCGTQNKYGNGGNREIAAAGNRHTHLVFYLFCAGMLLTAVASLRYAIGFDYFSYRTIYENTAEMGWIQIFNNRRQEILFYLLCKIVASCGLGYTGFLFIVTIFIHTAAMWFLYQYSKIPWVSVYLYIAFQFLAHNMNLLRQSIAAAFFLLAYPFLIKRRFACFLAIMVAGGLFHNSLFFMIPFYFLLPLKSNGKTLGILAGCSLFLYLFSDQIIKGLAATVLRRYASYLADDFYWQGTGVEYAILPAVYLVLVWGFRKRLRKEEPEYDIWVNSAFYTCVIQIFITKHFILERFSVYPFLLSLVVVPEIIASFDEVNKKNGREWYGLPEQEEIRRKRFHNRICSEATNMEGNGNSCESRGNYEKTLAVWKNQRRIVLLVFLVFGAAYFGFAAGKGFHHVYPYVGLWDRAVSNQS